MSKEVKIEIRGEVGRESMVSVPYSDKGWRNYVDIYIIPWIRNDLPGRDVEDSRRRQQIPFMFEVNCLNQDLEFEKEVNETPGYFWSVKAPKFEVRCFHNTYEHSEEEGFVDIEITLII